MSGRSESSLTTDTCRRRRLRAIVVMTIVATLGLAAMFIARQSVAAEKAGADGSGETAEKVSFHREVRPILRRHCQGCHQPAKPLGKLVLTSFAELKAGGESGEPAIVPGKPEESDLLRQISSQDGLAPAMPKGKPPLGKKDVALIWRWIAEGAADDTPMSDRVTVDMDHPPEYVLPPVLTSLDYSPDGKLLAVSGYHEVLLHDITADQNPSGPPRIVARLVGVSERIESAVFSPDGKWLAVTGGSPGRFGEVQIWDVAPLSQPDASARPKLTLSVNVGFDTLYGASWSPDGKMVAFGCPDNNVRAINPQTGEQVLQQGAHSDWVLDTVFSVDGSHLISVSRDRSTKLTEVATGRFVDNVTSITPGALKGGLMSVDTRPKTDPKMIDQIVVGGADGEPKLYRIYREKDRKIGDDFNRLRTFEKMPGRIFTVRFSRDGKWIVAGSSYNDGAGARLGEVRVYNADDGKRLTTLSEQGTAVYAANFSPDGKQVATAGFDGRVRLFDIATGKLLRAFDAVPIHPNPKR